MDSRDNLGPITLVPPAVLLLVAFLGLSGILLFIFRVASRDLEKRGNAEHAPAGGDRGDAVDGQEDSAPKLSREERKAAKKTERKRQKQEVKHRAADRKAHEREHAVIKAQQTEAQLGVERIAQQRLETLARQPGVSVQMPSVLASWTGKGNKSELVQQAVLPGGRLFCDRNDRTVLVSTEDASRIVQRVKQQGRLPLDDVARAMCEDT